MKTFLDSGAQLPSDQSHGVKKFKAHAHYSLAFAAIRFNGYWPLEPLNRSPLFNHCRVSGSRSLSNNGILLLQRVLGMCIQIT